MDKTQTPINSPNIAPTSPIIPTIPSKKGLLTLIIKIIAGVIGVIIVGGGISLAARIWDPLWNPFRPEPEKVIEKMVTKMEEVKTVHYNLEYVITSKEDSVKMTTRGEVDLDISDPNNIKTRGLVYVDIESVEVESEAISVNKLNFIKIIKYPGFQESFKNQWIKLDSEYSSNYQSIIEKVVVFFKDKEFYVLEQELSDKEINGVEVYHYTVSFKEDVSFLTTDNFETLSLLASLPFGDVMNIYIGKKDNLLYKLSFFGDTEIYSDIFDQSYKIDFSNYNEPLDIKEPDSYKTEKEVFGYSAEENKKNMAIKADLSSLRASAELYAMDNKESYADFCSSDDVLRASGRITENGSTMMCNDIDKAWAACAELIISGPSTYFCVNYRGNAEEITGTCDESWNYTYCQ